MPLLFSSLHVSVPCVSVSARVSCTTMTIGEGLRLSWCVGVLMTSPIIRGGGLGGHAVSLSGNLWVVLSGVCKLCVQGMALLLGSRVQPEQFSRTYQA